MSTPKAVLVLGRERHLADAPTGMTKVAVSAVAQFPDGTSEMPEDRAPEAPAGVPQAGHRLRRR